MTLEQATKAIKHGVIAACFSGVVTIIVTWIAISLDLSGKGAYYNDPWLLVDVILIFILAYGLYKRSRVAAVLMLVYFIAAKAVHAIDTGSVSGLIFAFIFVYLFARAVFGTFSYHRLQAEKDPEYRAVTKKGAALMGVGVVIFTVAISFSLLSVIGVLPSARVLAGHEIPEADITLLKEKGILFENQSIDFFYAQGATSILESGNILTEEQVLLYFTDENEQLSVYYLPIRDIVKVTLDESDSDSFANAYVVSTNDPDRWLKLYLSTEQKGDEKFIAKLRSKIKAAEPSITTI